jgi:hypothetical protein
MVILQHSHQVSVASELHREKWNPLRQLPYGWRTGPISGTCTGSAIP